MQLVGNKISTRAWQLFNLKLMVASLLIFPLEITGQENEIFWIDNFDYSNTNLRNKWVGRTKLAYQFYNIIEGTGVRNPFLRAEVKNSSEFIGRYIKVDIVKFPYLNWRWRVHKLPPGGNESLKAVCDVPASVNVLVSAKKTLGIPTPETIKYSWSTTLPKGTITKSPYAVWPSRCDIIVLQTGAQRESKWVYEKRNVLNDFKKLYKTDLGKTLEIDGIVLMSDSDNTNSEAIADYDSIYFSKN
jgi:hypothetical protein